MRVDAELVLKLRTARGWSQEDLARVTGLNLRTIQRIENTAIASLRSTSALAAALDRDIEDLDAKELNMSPCPECRSDEVYQYKDLIDSTTIGGELLPKLSTRRLSSARMRPVVCADCGFLRYFVEQGALQKMRSSEHWNRV
ncbi:MAG: helix-turn-helix transcriptional regulator [Chloroflexi bacterium]|nr:helix-turn-helix transcriptional regulator [Chloroflexota bacterium]MDA1146062.1 helix-turn-helix transcriptional regulator [Chloroflexota bacterium]